MVFSRLRVRVVVCFSFLFSLLAAFAPRVEAQTSFGTVAQGSSKSLAVTLTIPSTGSFSAISVVTQGAANLDYTNAGGGTCVAGSTYASGATCTVEVAFAPKHAGTRYGAVVLSTATGVVATAYLQGTGSGTLSQSGPGSTLQPFSSVAAVPLGIAVDGGGNVFYTVCNAGSAAVYKDAPAAGGSYTQTTVGSGWVCPGALAIDGAGNVYVFDGPDLGIASNAIYKLTLAGGVYTKGQAVSGFTNGTGLAVDGAGNLYAVDLLANGTTAVDKETLANGAYIQSSIGSGWNVVAGIAVDGAGNVYVANQPSALSPTVTIETPGSGGYTRKTTTIGSGFNGINGIAVDATGNLYVLDYESSFDNPNPSNVYLETPNGTSYNQTALGTGWVAPYALSVDASGDVFLLDNEDAFEIYLGATTPTTMSVTASPANPSWGQDVLITASVSAAGTKTVPTGYVTFNDGQANVATVPLSSTGTASWTAPGNTYGNPYNGQGFFTFTATYGGTESFGPSSGGVSVQWGFPSCDLQISPASGTYVGSVDVTASSSECSVTVSWPQGLSYMGLYNGIPFEIFTSQTVSATAGGGGYDYTTASATYTIVPALPSTGEILTVAGDGLASYTGDKGPAIAATLNNPVGIAVDKTGNSYIADQANNVVRKVTAATGIITTVAGTGTAGSSGNGGAATSALLSAPSAVALDAGGNLYIADNGNHVVRKVTAATGIIGTVAGDGTAGYKGDTGPATSAELQGLGGLAVDASGNLYLSDSLDNVIRKVSAAGTITTIVGNGKTGYGGDNGAATSAELSSPTGIAVDASGNLYIADTGNNVIRKVTLAGIISTIAGNQAGTGSIGAAGDGSKATSAALTSPAGVAVDANGNVYIADGGNSLYGGDNAVRKVNPAGIISTIAGTYFGGYGGDGGAATKAQLFNPLDVALDASDNVYIVDNGNQVIREALYGLTSAAPPPVFTPAAGTYSTAQVVSLTDSAAGATFYYTIDGSTPTATSAVYSGPIKVTANQTIKALAVATGYTASPVAAASYMIAAPAATPVFTPAAGTYTSAQTVTITDATAGATLYYTTNATTPTASSTKYTGPITVSSTETLEAIAVATGYANSAVAMAAYTITPPAATPVFSPAGGTYTSAQTVTIADATPGATIYYTTNGTAPTASSTQYTGAITVAATESIEAIAVAPGYANSAVATAAYTITPAPLASLAASTLWVSNCSNSIYLFDGISGAARSVLAAPGQVCGIAQTGGNLYTLDNGYGAVYEFSPTGSLVSTVVKSVSATQYDPARIAAGPDGDLYITLTTSNKVVRYTTSGSSLGTFATGPTSGNNALAGMAFSSNGFYVADFQGGSILKYALAGGAPSVVPLGASCQSQPDSLVFAPSGDLYASNICVSEVYDVTASSTVATGFRGNPRGMHFGPDGALYVASQDAGAIYRVAPSAGSAPTVFASGEGLTNAIDFQLVASSNLSFASQNVSTASAAQSALLANTGTAALAISSISIGGPNAADFKQTNTCGASLAPGANCILSLTFTPSAAGSRTAVLTVTDNSAGVAASTQTLNLVGTGTSMPNAATPVISLASGTFTSAQTVTITDATAGATIYYTTNATTPTASSTKYTGPITVSSTETLEAIAVATGYTNSAVATAAYTITPPAATPVFSPAGGTYTSAQTVTIADATAGATIYYTTNGTAPTASSTKYTGAITVSSTETLEAIAVASGYTNSAVAQAAYTITPRAATPVFSLAAGTYNSVQTVTIADATAGATIYYTTNGTAPTTASTRYTGAIAISSTETLEAIAVATGYTNSSVATATYTLQTAAPVFSPAAGTLVGAETVTIGDATLGATVYYTINGTTPTTSSAKYSGPIAVASTETLEAIATAPGFANSPVATAVYTVGLGTVPVISSVSAVTATATQTITITGSGFGTHTAYTGTSPYIGIWNVSEGNWSAGYGEDGIGLVVSSWTNTSIVLGGFTNLGSYGTLKTGDVLSFEVWDATTGNGPAPCSVTVGSGAASCTGLPEAGELAAFAGDGIGGYSGDGGPAASAELNTPEGLAVDGTGNVYIADYYNSRVRKVATSGTISTAAGNGTSGLSGDGGAATGAELASPYGAAIDASGNLYVSDYHNSDVRKITPAGVISSIVDSSGTVGYAGDGGAAASAKLDGPKGLAIDASGNLYIADSYNQRIRKVTPAGIISTVAGNGTAGYSGDNGAATNAELNYPSGVAVDASGNLYIADQNNNRIRKVTPAGTITTLAGTGTAGYSGDGGGATVAELKSPSSVAVDASGDIFIADSGNQRVRMLTPGTIIATVAGTGAQGSAGSGLAAIDAPLNGPASVAVDASGNLYVGDTGTFRVLKVSFSNDTLTAATPAISPAPGTYNAAQMVTIADATPGATIYYTTNGSSPTIGSTQYTGAITVSATETLKAIAVAPGYSASAVATAAYTITPPAAAPAFSLPGGTYTGAVSVTLTDATAGATIYYTTNGTTPTASSTKYTGAIAIPATPGLTETVEAIAVAAGYTSSPVATAVYTIMPPAATPVISPASGTYTSVQTVTITDATPSATIYYTTNGSVPTTSSTKYTGPISVSSSETIEAKAIATGYSLSSPAIAAYTITLTAAVPTFSVGAGTYESVQTVTLASTTPGATIYYTTNGTAPTTASTQYTGAIGVAASETVEAIAVATGYVNSPVATASYTIVGSPTALAESATSVTSTTATLNALVNLEGISGSYYFAWGTSSTALTNSTATVALTTQGTVPVSTALTGLTPGTTYYFKVVVTTAGGSASGATLSF
jgi:hypothetical protein